MKFWRLIGHYDAVSTTYTECAGAMQTSPYTPDFSGTLKGLRGIVGGGAATSLVQHVQFRISCTTFRPNVIHCAAQGTGLQTAPAFMQGPLDWEVEQPVQAGVPITVEARNEAGAETPVTDEVQLYALFEIN